MGIHPMKGDVTAEEFRAVKNSRGASKYLKSVEFESWLEHPNNKASDKISKRQSKDKKKKKKESSSEEDDEDSGSGSEESEKSKASKKRRAR